MCQYDTMCVDWRSQCDNVTQLTHVCEDPSVKVS